MGLVQFVPRVISVQDNIADFNLPTSVHLDLLVEASEGGIFYIVSHVRAWQSHSCFPGIGNRFGHQVDAVIDGAKEWVYLQEVQNNGMSRVSNLFKTILWKILSWATNQRLQFTEKLVGNAEEVFCRTRNFLHNVFVKSTIQVQYPVKFRAHSNFDDQTSHPL